jgi:hypothetical protein
MGIPRPVLKGWLMPNLVCRSTRSEADQLGETSYHSTTTPVIWDAVRMSKMSGVASRTAPALVVLGQTAIHMTIGPKVSSPVLDDREASGLDRRVLETAVLHRRLDLRNDGVVPQLVKGRVEHAMSSLLGDLVEIGAGRGDGEGVRLEIGAPQELRRIARDAVIVEVHLVFRDQIGGDDGAGV